MNQLVITRRGRAERVAIRLLLCVVAVVFCVSSRSGWAVPEIESWTTKEGARVLFLEARELPILDVIVEFPAGSGRDQPGKEGLARMTLSLMKKGTRSRDEHQLSEALAGIGAQLSGSFDLDRSGFVLRTLSDLETRSQALDVFREVLVAPSFPQSVLAREKARSIAFIEERQTRPGVIVAQTFQRELYGTHPYAEMGAGEAETIANLTRDDLREFHRRYFVADEAVVTIVGDVSSEQAASIASNLTSDLPRARVPVPALPAVPERAESTEIVIPHAASQAHVRIGMPGVRRGDPDYFPLWVAVQILGGSGMTSLLNEELREARGLTYSVYSYFSPYSQPGPFVITLQTRKDQTWEALDVALMTLEKFVAEGPTEEQLQAAKQYVIGGFALNIDSNAELVEYLAMIGFYRLPLDYLETFPREIEQLSLARVQDALKRRLTPSKTVTVVVGPSARP